jgi:hypothetical protein
MITTLRAAVSAATVITLAAGLASADIPVPTTIKAYFTKGGQPVHQPVSFKVRCFGWKRYPGQPGFGTDARPEHYKPAEVYGYSANCPDSGCSIAHNLYLNYTHIECCSIEGTVGGQAFSVARIDDPPVGKCPASKAGGGFEKSCDLRVALPK